MAKRPLKPPDVPPGARYEFFMFMQRLVTDNGDLSTPALGKLIGHSHQAVYKTLTGTTMPSRAIAERLAQALGGITARDSALSLWEKGVQEQRGFTNATSTYTPRPRADAAQEGEGPHIQPTTAPRGGALTKLDKARAYWADEDLASSWENRPSKTMLWDSDRLASAAFADEIWRLVSAAGGDPRLFTADSARSGFPDWITGDVLPTTHNLLNFAYELRLDELQQARLSALHAAAVEEQRPPPNVYRT
ncbi:hypothetical protein NLM24_08100 [Nocardia zapadnayensis]|uniref:hypothetical protein n=1 Tax=Nocardia rhamnosiphila TaxID=426716 RepID=UPI0022486A60|nr:hypothetical protein [Nocardia zapadnayensis]MCX0270666.1 hypothetical protein [Nocardia zapadnayensis]